MDNDKQITTNRTNAAIGELVNAANYDMPQTTTSNSTRTYSSPLMGTSARAAKRRIDTDSIPLRIDGTETSNQFSQPLYQNTHQTFDDQASFNTKRDFVQQESKSAPWSYDSSPREKQPVQKMITTITTVVTNSPTQHKRSNSLAKQSSPSIVPVDRLLEQPPEVQRLTNSNLPPSTTTAASNDLSKRDVSRTPSIPVTKTSYVTDIDDHQAIQQLTRVLQAHSTATANESKRLPSQTTPILINTTTTTTTTSFPSTLVVVDGSNQANTSEFTVIDALLDNPLGTNDSKKNASLHARFTNILTNLRNADYVNVLKQSTAKMSKKKRAKKSSTNARKAILVDKETQMNEAMIDPSGIASDQKTLLPSKGKKKRTKVKAKKLAENIDYQVIDALISSPISLRLPNSVLTKYKVRPPQTQLSLSSSIIDRTNHNNNTFPLLRQLDPKAKDETAYNLVNVVNELFVHHGPSPATSIPIESTNQSIKPRVFYRYMDEQGNILKISPTAPSDLRASTTDESPINVKSRRTEPTYLNSRRIAVEDDQRSPWLKESKLPATSTRQDFELLDRRVPKLSERPSSITRTVPINYDYQHPIKTSIQPHSNRENVQLSWLPLSHHLDQPYNRPTETTGYDSDSSDSDRSIPYRSRYEHRPLFEKTYPSNQSPIRSYRPPSIGLTLSNRDISPDFSTNNISRNYIEVFRGGESQPSEVYSLPFKESVPLTQRHSRFDQYETDKQQRKQHTSSSPTKKSTKIIPTLSNHALQSSPNRQDTYLDNYLRHSKSFDYRPLRTKLQREYKITPSLLLDEWDQTPFQSISATDTNLKPSVSSPDDVFVPIKLRWHPKKPIEKPTNGHTEQPTWPSRQEIVDSNRPKPQAPRLNTQPIYKALALHSFYAQTNRELSFKKGDILLVLRRINDDWLEGEHQGCTGIFPLNHVELFPIEQVDESNVHEKDQQETEGEAIVKYDFIPQKTFELQLRRGDKVTLLRRLDDNWYEGRLNHIEGIFPTAYVETLREPPDDFTKNIELNEPEQSVKQPTPEPEQPTVEKTDPIPDASLPLQKCQVLYDYTPQNPDELEIHVGDIINIIEMCDDGWYCGIIEKSKYKKPMEFGTFPGNYVKLLSTT